MDVNITTTIHDINVAVASAGFLKEHPMPQIPDPEDEGETIDKYPSVKVWLEAWNEGVILKHINRGIDKINKESGQSHLTEL